MFHWVIASGTCVVQCLRNAAKPEDRWSNGACVTCCMQDMDGDNFITKDDLAATYDMYCGGNENQAESKYL